MNTKLVHMRGLVTVIRRTQDYLSNIDYIFSRTIFKWVYGLPVIEIFEQYEIC